MRTTPSALICALLLALALPCLAWAQSTPTGTAGTADETAVTKDIVAKLRQTPREESQKTACVMSQDPCEPFRVTDYITVPKQTNVKFTQNDGTTAAGEVRYNFTCQKRMRTYDKEGGSMLATYTEHEKGYVLAGFAYTRGTLYLDYEQIVEGGTEGCGSAILERMGEF